jgi:hypothetical protein
VSLFDDQAAQLLDQTANELFDMQRSGQDTRVEAVYKKAFFTECYLSLRFKMESYNDKVGHMASPDVDNGAPTQEASKRLLAPGAGGAAIFRRSRRRNGG